MRFYPIIVLYCCGFLLPMMSIATGVALYPFANPVEAERFDRITQEVRCVVCQNQSIADSNAPLAKDLREKIYHLVQQQKSEADIKTYLRKRYGDFILLQPRLTLWTWFLWGFPVFSSLLIIGFSVYSLINRVEYVRIKNNNNI
jgi:cytochrome c-type biogenesis protein CcmH